MASILDVKSLTAGYDGKPVIHDISMTVEPGNFISIVAPNGTGKTTLLKCLSGVLPAFDGDIRLKDRDIKEYSRRELARIVAVAGEGSDTFDYTAQQIVTMGRYPHIGRFSPLTVTDHALVEAAMESVKIWHKRNSAVGQLSQGEKQKVIIARALVQCPQLLLMDEPTSHLDVYNQFAILQTVRNLAKQRNIGVVAVIHDINLALQFSSHIMLLKEGRIVAFGEPQSVLSAELLRSVYGIDFILHSHTGLPFVQPYFAQ